MLPEINQVIRMEEECREYFGDEAVALHGNIPQRKKIKLWNDIRSGKYKLVIGTRISVFAPITNLGLIIIFDEHDGAYKQQELSPRYNARDVAIKRGDIDDSVVLMSSSTPDVRVYYAALENKVRFLSLPKKTKVQNYLEELFDFSILRKSDCLNTNIKRNKVFHYDFKKLWDNHFDMNPFDVHMPKGVEVSLSHSENQIGLIRTYETQYGTSLIGLGRILLRANMDRLYLSVH